MSWGGLRRQERAGEGVLNLAEKKVFACWGWSGCFVWSCFLTTKAINFATFPPCSSPVPRSARSCRNCRLFPDPWMALALGALRALNFNVQAMHNSTTFSGILRRYHTQHIEGNDTQKPSTGKHLPRVPPPSHRSEYTALRDHTSQCIPMHFDK